MVITPDNLYRHLNNSISMEVNNIEYDQVKDDVDCNSLIASLENKYRFHEVVIGNPEIRRKSLIQSNRDEYIEVEVVFPVTGTKDLFDYRITRGDIHSGNGDIFKPKDGLISIIIKQNPFDEESAISEVNNKISKTKNLVKNNYIEVANWNEGLNANVTSQVNNQRNQLRKLWGE